MASESDYDQAIRPSLVARTSRCCMSLTCLQTGQSVDAETTAPMIKAHRQCWFMYFLVMCPQRCSDNSLMHICGPPGCSCWANVV